MHHNQSQRKGYIISTATISAAGITSDKIDGASTSDATLFHTSVKLVANTANWRKVIKDLIGDEPVSYAEKSKKDTLRKFPIVNIMSTDKEALDRVLTKAAEVE